MRLLYRRLLRETKAGSSGPRFAYGCPLLTRSVSSPS